MEQTFLAPNVTVLGEGPSKRILPEKNWFYFYFGVQSEASKLSVHKLLCNSLLKTHSSCTIITILKTCECF